MSISQTKTVVRLDAYRNGKPPYDAEARAKRDAERERRTAHNASNRERYAAAKAAKQKDEGHSMAVTTIMTLHRRVRQIQLAADGLLDFKQNDLLIALGDREKLSEAGKAVAQAGKAIAQLQDVLARLGNP